MPEQSLRQIADTLLAAAHRASNLGTILESGGSGLITIDTPEGQAEAITFLLDEVRILETLVKRLCTEVDALRPT
jgi:hypothetical protein